MLEKFSMKTNSRDDLLDVTEKVQRIVSKSKVKSGLCIVYVPHTTAGVTINENADPAVPHDILKHLAQIIPWQADYFKHFEGNSAAHIKSSLIGSSVNVIIENSKLVLGTWQSIFFCEFDGARKRSIFVKIIKTD